MPMTPRLRKFALLAHVTFSVGWLGAVAGFLALALAGLTGQDEQKVRAAYLAMEMIGGYVIVPFGIASLLTGLVQSLGTEWGLFRHYWILAKFLLTILATVLLLVHLRPIGRVASAAADPAAWSSADLGRLRIQLVADAGAALLVLLAATALSVYKPWGRTPYGLRQRQERRMASEPVRARRLAVVRNWAVSHRAGMPLHSGWGAARPAPAGAAPARRSWGLFVLLHGIAGLVLLFAVLHLAGGGMGHH
jgi:hypothetical protein